MRIGVGRERRPTQNIIRVKRALLLRHAREVFRELRKSQRLALLKVSKFWVCVGFVQVREDSPADEESEKHGQKKRSACEGWLCDAQHSLSLPNTRRPSPV